MNLKRKVEGNKISTDKNDTKQNTDDYNILLYNLRGVSHPSDKARPD